jgi:regulatory protein
MSPKAPRQQQSSLDAAYRYLGYRPRSEFETRIWLERKGFTGREIGSTLATLKAKALLDDLAFARFWRESRDSSSPRSRTALGRELRQKGIDPDVVAEALDGLDEEAAAYRAAQKKASRLRALGYNEFYHRLGAVLRRRGFSYEVTERTVNRLWQESAKNA